MNKGRFNRHHIIGRSMNRSDIGVNNPEQSKFNVEDKRNIRKMDMKKHQLLHAFVWRKNNAPKQQFDVLREITESVLSPIAKNLLDALLSLPDEVFYDEWLVQPKKPPKKYRWF